jgi:hypothetical protein
MAKRPTALDALRLVAEKPAARPPSYQPQEEGLYIVQPPAPKPRERMTTAVHLYVDQWERLRAIAQQRVAGTRARPSVSALIVQMIDDHLDEYEAAEREYIEQSESPGN